MGTDDYMASIGLTAGIYAPLHTALCQGQLMPVSQNTALFSLLNVTHGGNGTSTFALPNLAGSTVVGTGPRPGIDTNWQLGQVQTPLTPLAWPGGKPAATPAGGTPTLPIATGPAGLALHRAITLIGFFPPNPNN